MNVIAEYRGNMLNHVEALYRAGDRNIAIELGEVLGCIVVDTGINAGQGSTFLAVHPNPDDLDVDNNAFYLSKITPVHAAVEAALEAAQAADVELRERVAEYREKALNWPFSIPHFGLRYQSEAEIEAVGARQRPAKSARPGEDHPPWRRRRTHPGYYTTKYDFTAGAGGQLQASRQKEHAIVNLTGSFSPGGGKVELGWFVKNLFNVDLISLISTGNTGVYMTPDEPRTYGVTVRYSF